MKVIPFITIALSASATLANPEFAGFTAPTFLPIGNGPQELAVADMNGDGIEDIVVGIFVGDQLVVLLSRGDGTFDEPLRTRLQSGVLGIAVGDVDNDGDIDVMATQPAFGAGVATYLNDGKGILSLKVIAPAGASPADAALGDVNGDGVLDLAATSQIGSDVFILFGAGDGTFEPAASYPVGNVPTDVKLGDLDNDGDLDLVVTGGFTDDVTIRWNDGDGSFPGAETIVTGQLPFRALLIDFDNDEDLDIALAMGNNGVGRLLNSNEGFILLPFIAVGAGSGTGSIVARDFNLDGMLDLVAEDLNPRFPSLGLLLGDGIGNFIIAGMFNISSPSTRGVAALDLDGDGDLDIIAANRNEDRLAILFNLTVSPAAKSVDLNDDGFVNGVDLAHLLANWGGDGPADLNNSGAVNGADLTLLLNAWGRVIAK